MLIPASSLNTFAYIVRLFAGECSIRFAENDLQDQTFFSGPESFLITVGFQILNRLNILARDAVYRLGELCPSYLFFHFKIQIPLNGRIGRKWARLWDEIRQL